MLLEDAVIVEINRLGDLQAFVLITQVSLNNFKYQKLL